MKRKKKKKKLKRRNQVARAMIALNSRAGAHETARCLRPDHARELRDAMESWGL